MADATLNKRTDQLTIIFNASTAIKTQPILYLLKGSIIFENVKQMSKHDRIVSSLKSVFFQEYY